MPTGENNPGLAARRPRPARSSPLALNTRTQVLILAIAAFAQYARALPNGFLADDKLEVLQDPLIRSFRLIPQMFAHSVWYCLGGKGDRHYRPLKLLAYSVESCLRDVLNG